MAVINIFQLAARKNLIQVSLNVITIVMVLFDTSDLFSRKVFGLSRHLRLALKKRELSKKVLSGLIKFL
jgi:hypothetical protein